MVLVTRIVTRLLLLTLGVVLACGFAECGLRVVGYAGEGDRTQRVYDKRYGAVPRDSWIWSFDIDPARHHAVELRGQRVSLPKPEGERRVLFVGDSATEGAFVSETENFPAVFGQLVGASVRVLNAGVWGMTSIDEYHLLADKLLPLQPDVVVIGLFMANDINMNLAHRQLVAQQTSFWGRITQLSALAHFVRLKLLAAGARDTGALTPVELKLVDERGLRMLSYPEGELATYVQPESALVEGAYTVLEDVLRDFQRLGREHGFAVRVLLIPSPSHVLGRLAILHYPHLLQELAHAGLHIAEGDIDVDAPTKRVLAVCARLSMTCVDPTAALQHLGPRAFFPEDEHPSAAAHRVLARALASSP
ncbi:MAG TPA: SGNH/GDSL hydrolase family protein [Polyangiales bacterium]|nr:SGNH/GDSL hydrolase family protein [Polyangiales bacterium]